MGQKDQPTDVIKKGGRADRQTRGQTVEGEDLSVNFQGHVTQ